MESLWLDTSQKITAYLLPPVIWGLGISLLWLVYQSGTVARRGIQRWQTRRQWIVFLLAVRDGQQHPEDWTKLARGGISGWICKRFTDWKALNGLLREAEVFANRELSIYQILIRTGPMFGLMGTLIPLGPALQGLSQSNLVQLSSNLHIAFTTTVFGIFVGAYAYVLLVIERHWYETDLTELESLVSYAETRNSDRAHTS